MNDAEHAVGLYQITPIFVDDINRLIGKEKFTLDDRYSALASETMIFIYLNHYARAQRLGHEATNQDLAALHCAGPDGDLQKDELKVKEHWEKVKAVLEANERKLNDANQKN